jgi:hypothetical protein
MKIEELIKKTTYEINQYEKNKPKGSEFNLFSILRKDNDEVGLHSKFIFELLNNKSNHGFGNDFLRIFLDILIEERKLKLPYFIVDELNSVKIMRERENIDLLLLLPFNYTIIIENKINAEDQEKQLFRYYNKMLNKFNCEEKKITILYLTLNGREPTEDSKNGLKSKIECISYDNEISLWLAKCTEHSKNCLSVTETIRQYSKLLDKLLGKEEDKVMNKIEEYLLLDCENLNSAIAISNALPKAKSTILMNFMHNIKECFESKGLLANEFDEEPIKNYYGYRNTVPYIRFDLYEIEKNIYFTFYIAIDTNLFYNFSFSNDNNENYFEEKKSKIQKKYPNKYKKCYSALKKVFCVEFKDTETSILWEHIYNGTEIYNFKIFADNCIKLIDKDNSKKEAMQIAKELVPKILEIKKYLSK